MRTATALACICFECECYLEIINIYPPKIQARANLHQEGLVRLMSKETWKFILQTLAAILTAIATTLGVTSCLGA